MYFLSIESSCDETSLAILEGELKAQNESFVSFLNSFKVVSHLISSQIKTHAKYGGVIPEIGAREHTQHIHKLFEDLIKDSVENEELKIKDEDIYENQILSDLGYIFVTTNPGLASALKVGLEFARSLQFFLFQKYGKNVKVVEINHLKGHVASSFYKLEENKTLKNSVPTLEMTKGNDLVFPHLHLLVSGGNSQIILLNSWKDFEIVGKTLDDAAGETFDKIGRMLGLKYPGGVWLSKIAGLESENYYNFPISMKTNKELNYSFSGLKTAVRYFIQKQTFKDWKFERKLNDEEIEELLDIKNQEKENIFNKKKEVSDYFEFIYKVCVSAQFVVTSQLINKLKLAEKKYQPKSIGLSGGVSANNLLKQGLMKEFKRQLFIPNKELTGDNAAMIALAGLADFYLD